MQTSTGVSTKTSMNSSGPTSSRTMRRSARYGETKAHSTTSPASTISRATSPARERGHPGGNRAGADAVDEDDGAAGVIVLVRIERNRPRGSEIAEADLVHLQHARGGLGAGRNVELVPERGHRCGGRLRAEPQRIGAARQEVRLVEPDEVRGELIRHRGP